MRRGRAREPSLPCCDDPGVVVYSLFFSLCLPRETCGGKGGLGQYMNEAMALWAFVCVCVRTCVWNKIFSSFLHTSCELFYAERKAGEDDQRFIFMF